jgi:hypothetical protein
MFKDERSDDEIVDGAGETRPVDKWRDELFPRQTRGRPHPDAWKHAAAATLHDWPLHQHHAATPMELTRADYEAALAASESTDASGAYVPHPAALSEFSSKAPPPPPPVARKGF